MRLALLVRLMRLVLLVLLMRLVLLVLLGRLACWRPWQAAALPAWR
jgi:hypothetical protein